MIEGDGNVRRYTFINEFRNANGSAIASSDGQIPVYWIINLLEDQVEVYTESKAGKAPTFRQRQDFRMDESVPLIIAGKRSGRIAVRDLLP